MRWLPSALVALATAACGARTGLDVPDVATFPDAQPDVHDAADVLDVVDVPHPGCRDGSFPLEQRAAEVLLVIDRSGSMGEGLARGLRGAPSKWSLLRGALATTLPVYQDRILTGSLFYPESGAGTRGGTCLFANIPDVDIGPATGSAAAILNVFDGTNPGGSTPTAAALLRAYTYFVRHPDRARGQYLVLATDGGPNCNANLDPRTCVCVGGPMGFGNCGRDTDGTRCLDDRRTVDEIAQMASNPIASIPTYIIGLADPTDPTFATTLRNMAIAGGRPLVTATGQRTYYDVEQPGDLERAFTSIQDAIARCSFVTPSRPTSTGGIAIRYGSVEVPYDPTRLNGWDWTDRAFGEITLFGAACDGAIAARSTTVTAVVSCGATGG